MRKVVPLPIPSDSAEIFPFCAMISALQIANPNPILPLLAFRDLSAR